MKKFKSRSKFIKRIPYLVIFLIITYLSFISSFKFLFDKYLKTTVTNEKIINYLVDHNLNQDIATVQNLNDIFSINIKQPESIIRYTLGNVLEISENDEEGNHSDYIEDPNPPSISEPLIYIYNTHQTEAYQARALSDYNIEPNVLMASYLLREKLNDLGIPTIVETQKINDILKNNNWAYSKSYEASRQLITAAQKQYPTIKYLIDLHRDSSNKKATTTTIDGQNYAKVLFVVGKEHSEYEKNLNLATSINEMLKEVNPSLSRGIYLKEGPGVNGIYNQDLSNNSLLIELGGQYNSIEEASNTINILANILHKFIIGDQNGKKA